MIQLLDMQKCGDAPDTNDIQPTWDHDKQLVLDPGEHVQWVGVAVAAEATRNNMVTGASDAWESLWRIHDKVDVTVTDRRVVWRVRDLAKNQLGTMFVWGAGAMIAGKLFQSVKMRNMVASGQLRFRWVMALQTRPARRGQEILLYAVDQPNQVTAVRVALTLRDASPAFAEQLVSRIAENRIDTLARFRDTETETDSFERLAGQATNPTEHRTPWGELFGLALPATIVGDQVPFSIERHRRDEERKRLASFDLDGLATAAAISGDGVRAAGPARTVEIAGYRFVLPLWWDSVEVTIPDTINTVDELEDELAKMFGSQGGGAEHWREAVKAIVTVSQRLGRLPTTLPGAYIDGQRPGHAALLLADLSDFSWSIADSDPLREFRGWYIAKLGLWAGTLLEDLGCPAAARVHLGHAASMLVVGRQLEVDGWATQARKQLLALPADKSAVLARGAAPAT